MEQIERLIANDQLEQARRELAQARATRPTDPQPRFLEAALAAREGRFRDAAIALVELLADTPDHALAMLLQGRVQQRLGQTDAARASFDDALLLDSKLAAAHVCATEVNVLNADLDGLQKRYRESLQDDPTAVEYRLALAGVLLRQGEFEDVLFELQPLLEAEPPVAHARLIAAAAELARGRHTEALRLLDLIGDEPAGSPLAPALLRLLCLYWSSHLAAADAHAAKLLDAHPDLAQVWILRAEILLGGGYLQNALDAATRAMTLRPQLSRAHRTQALSLMRMGDPTTAEAILGQHLNRHPTDGATWRVLLAIMAHRQAHAAAVPMARRWVEACPEEADAHADLAALLEHQSELDAAMHEARAALRLRSDHINALLIAARAELRIGRPGPVLAKLDRVEPSGLEPGQQEARLVLLARAADAQGDVEQAAQRWQERHLKSPHFVSMRPLPGAAAMTPPTLAGPWPPAAERVAFLVGLPGSGVQHLAASLRNHPEVLLAADRFSATARFDGFSQPDWPAFQNGLSEGQAMVLRRRWRKALQRRGALPTSALLIDWLPHIDVLLHSALASVFPGAPLIIVERDLKDCMLDWLAFPGLHRLRFDSAAQAGQWLAAAASHLDTIVESERMPVVRVRFDELLDQPQQRMAQLLQQLGLEPGSTSFRADKTLGDLPGHFPAGHAARYQDPLTEGYKALRKGA